ncbi:TrbG/VirB9 family P-type conjugative transfer protein [Aliivibrio fischeri]|uniref:TrbG/VirB9 family P-type conjugative transfer protein n=1 Tax=Aliivibrio fischeri TaxID=668 RepID=UPI0018C836B3|nr:TrbG/VirB9 family P-type conjugative transfer protein [Aliivibrio fischeri]
MKKLLLLCLLVSFPSFATKGLIDSNILAKPQKSEKTGVPNPKVGSENGILDLTLLGRDRTNQAMVLTSLNTTQEVFDKSNPFDNTLRTNYLDNKTIKLRVREFMGTLIVLPKGDTIAMFKLGDIENFSFEPSMNPYDDSLPRSGTASVTLAGADTSLHILGTSGNIYTFYLRGDTWDSPHNPTMKVLITDDKLMAKIEAEKRRALLQEKKEEAEKVADLQYKGDELQNPDYLESVPFDPSKIDFGYRIVGGDENIRPFMVYSDDHFTYFRYDDENSVKGVKSFPTVYRVADGSDVPVNTSPNGSTLRVEGVANKWTLRLGDKWLCIERLNPIPNIQSSMNVLVSEKDNTEFKPSHELNKGGK